MLGLDQDKAEHELKEREIPGGGSFCDRDRRNQIFCFVFFFFFFALIFLLLQHPAAC